MKCEHRILPTRRPTPVPLHTPTKLSLYLFLGLFLIFSLLLLSSRLAPQKVTGRTALVATTLNVTGGQHFNCNLTIPAGTSLLSLPCLPIEEDVSQVLANLSSGGANVKALYKYTPTTSGRWQAYNGSLPSWVVQSLQNFGNQDGVYFLMAAQDSFFYQGYLPQLSVVPLRPGWNLVGWPTNKTENLSEALASINDTYRRIRAVNGTVESGGYLEDWPPPGGQNLTNVSIYHGYWINMSATDHWVIA